MTEPKLLPNSMAEGVSQCGSLIVATFTTDFPWETNAVIRFIQLPGAIRDTIVNELRSKRYTQIDLYATERSFGAPVFVIGYDDRNTSWFLLSEQNPAELQTLFDAERRKLRRWSWRSNIDTEFKVLLSFVFIVGILALLLGAFVPAYPGALEERWVLGLFGLVCIWMPASTLFCSRRSWNHTTQDSQKALAAAQAALAQSS